MKLRLFFVFGLISLLSLPAFGQGNLTGSLESVNKFFMRDSLIGATGTPQYNNQLVGSYAWLTLNYTNFEWGLTGGIRLDIFNNSDLQNPVESFSGAGIGRWYVQKKVKDLVITGGHIYDQIGAGIIFRAYEERALAIDNALFGVQAEYFFNDNWSIKGFTGQQKNIFQRYDPIIRGVTMDGFHQIKEGVSIAPGFGIVNRTLDERSMDVVVSNIQSYPVEDRFVPRYNMYAFSLFNRLDYKNFSWYIEGAYKTHEAINDNNGFLVDKDGSLVFSSLSYSRSGLGLTAQMKRTETFNMRTSPNETILEGMLNFMPPMARQNVTMLTARYNAATQELGEMAYQFDVVASPNKDISFTGTYSNVRNLSGDLLFNEVYLEGVYKKGRDWKVMLGTQVVHYNQLVFEQKGDSSLQSIVPFAEFTYRFNRTYSIRAELQYMNNEDDFGSWVNGLVELSMAPKWTLAVGDMWNIVPKNTEDALHYPTVFAGYRTAGNMFTLAYVKQVEGIVCTGGVCRFEPAFSGVRFSLSSTF